MHPKILLVLLFNSAILGWSRDFARGVDISWLSELESVQRKFYTSEGIQKDLLDILPAYCINSIRLRVWVNPTDGWSNQADMLALATRAYAKGYRLMIDFHYSDSWADPAQQVKPTAWRNYSTTELAQAIYDHTYHTLTLLKTAQITPTWVQIGNETNDGMLWPEGRPSISGMANYASFIKSGHQAAKAVFPQVTTLVHLANSDDTALYQWNIGGLVSNNAEFDAIAMSLYPDSANWQTLVQKARSNMDQLIVRYHKPIMVSEIGFPVSQPAIAKAFVESILTQTSEVSNDQGLGVFWWEPEAYNWRGYDKVAWNDNGQPTQAMEGFLSSCPEPHPQSLEITFQVDMTGQDTSQGVLITGDITHQQMLPMHSLGNNLFTITLTISSKTTGSYYYRTNTYRETVPQSCAFNQTNRVYSVDTLPITLKDTWGLCENPTRNLSPSSLKNISPPITQFDLLGRKSLQERP